ncbi:hypothetical protein HMPREF6745_0823 [Prevotella sp. oral taxon 472 str. F0295]|nr:hypothetical protein HMPREF6745_0823 [Prevotella sp. oral taxon 472 str. F0295]
MKFISIIGKSHISHQYTITHLRISFGVAKEQIVLSGNGKTFVGKLRAPLASFFHHQPRPRLATATAVWKEAQCEVPLGQLTNLPCPLQCIGTKHLETCVHTAKVTYERVRAKDRPTPLPLRFPIFFGGCTENGKLSGAWCFSPFVIFVFYLVAYFAVETQQVRFYSRVKDVRYCPAQQNYCLLHVHLFAPNYPLSNTKKALSRRLYPFCEYNSGLTLVGAPSNGGVIW